MIVRSLQVSDFYELEVPEADGAYGWFVITKLSAYAGAKHWLRKDGVVTQHVQNADNFYYDCQMDAFAAIKRYYHDHNQTFPYVTEMLEDIRDGLKVTSVNTEDVGSRVLEL